MIRSSLVAVVLLALAACGGAAAPATPSITVFAAASLQPAFQQIGKQFRSRDNINVEFSFAGTQSLVEQIQQGAPADVFASADTAHMTSLQNSGLIAGEPQVFARNRLEIAVEKGNPKHITGLADLARPGIVVVLADPSVPAGKYAQQALAKAHVTVHPASLENQVTAVVSKVALGEADAGIVYVSDIVTGHVGGVPIPDAENVIAQYPIATLKSAHDASAADQFISFVLSADGQALLKAAGFSPV